MSSAYMSVAEAAEMLGVHAQRVHQRIRDGSLPAEKVGHQWVIRGDDLHRVKQQVRPGRPLSSKSAWDLLAVSLGEQASSSLSPSARSLARSRLRNLIVHTSSAELEDAVVQVQRALRNRGHRALFHASPRDLPDLRKDQRIHLSGVSAPESNLSSGDVAEGYLHANDLDVFAHDYLLSPALRSDANVILHVVPGGAKGPSIGHVEAAARSPLGLAADLAEHDGVREKSRAIRALADVHTHLINHRRPKGKGDRD